MNRPATNRISFPVLLLISLMAFSASACKRKKNKNNQQAVTIDTAVDNCHLDRRLPKPIIADMWKNEFHFEWLSMKMGCEASDDSSKMDFNVSVRIRKDSVIWMNVTDPVVGITVARALITKDSVKFVQFQDGTLSPEPKCFLGDFAFLSSLLGVEVDFDMMQSLLVGNSATFYTEDEKLKASINQSNCMYVLSTIRKRKLRKVLDGQIAPPEPLQTITIDPSTFKIMRILFLDAGNRSFTADYSDFSKEDTLVFPHHAVFFGKSPGKSAQLDVTYNKVKLNQPLEFPFTIPDDCKPIIIQQAPKQDH